MRLLSYLFESAASEQAKQLGLKLVAFGQYEDPKTGMIVAKIVKNKLEMLDTHQSADSKGSSKEDLESSKQSSVSAQTAPGKEKEVDVKDFVKVDSAEQNGTEHIFILKLTDEKWPPDNALIEYCASQVKALH